MDGQEKEKEEMILTVQMRPSYLFDFLFWHSYHGFYGVLNIGFSLLAVVLLIGGAGRDNVPATVALIVLALLFTVINPLLLYRKAYRQVKRSPMFQKPIEYVLDREAITVRQGGETAAMAWSDVLLLRETKTNLALYFGAANAVVLPKAECGAQTDAVKRLLKEVLPEQARRLKKMPDGQGKEHGTENV